MTHDRVVVRLCFGLLPRFDACKETSAEIPLLGDVIQPNLHGGGSGTAGAHDVVDLAKRNRRWLTV